MADKPPHILVIDDAPEEIRSLLALLSAQSWQLSLTTKPHQGLHKARALHPDLILLDVRMPRMDGFALCRLLRESSATRHIPVIFLTHAVQLKDRLRGLSEGGVDYIAKPFEAQEVLARIRVHLNLSHRPITPASPAASEENNEQLLLRAATGFIDTNLGEALSLEQIATAVGTYEKHLSRLFRQHLGHSVFSFIRHQRLQRSVELLAGSDISIQEIAQLVGFRNPGNFSTAFRERQGMTPREFREQVKKNRNPL